MKNILKRVRGEIKTWIRTNKNKRMLKKQNAITEKILKELR